MSDSNPRETVDINNERSLKTLIRAISFTSGRRFSLILVRCNYRHLQEQMLQRLRDECPVEIRELMLPRSAHTLYTAIQTEFGDEQLPALMVLGLENVGKLDDLLLATNQVRDEFSKSFKFPLVLWVTDEVLKKMMRLAPDFHNWAATPISFFLSKQELIDLLRERADSMFGSILAPDAGSLNGRLGKLSIQNSNSQLPTRQHRQELEFALKDLQKWGRVLEPDLAASVDLVLGWDEYNRHQIDAAIEKYLQSLAVWQQTENLERQGVLLFHLGLCHLRYAELNRAENKRYWAEARHYFQQSVEVFEQAQRPDLVAELSTQLGEVLQNLEQWDELQALAQKSLSLHQTYGSSIQLARDYGFLAEVALKRSNWVKAKRLAQQALQLLAETSINQGQGLYLLLLAQAQQGLNCPQDAVNSLERAKIQSAPQDDPRLYIRILEALRVLYFEQKQYLKAFQVKQERQLIEGQYGFRAFVGASRLQPQPQIRSGEGQGVVLSPGQTQEVVAQEIAVSGRQFDVNRLIERIVRDDCKLTVIHGESGVGKSSTVNAGLIPALKQKIIKTRDVLPIPLRFYSNWIEALGELLTEALATRGEAVPQPLNSTAEIVEQLQQNENRNLITVWIFDQFEEFFFVYASQAARRPFFEFLSTCLNIPYVKVIFSLREDYLHYLLECERLAKINVINNDILNKGNRYELGNFSREDAKSIIEGLTERSQFYLEPALVDELVRDLAEDTDMVRPIELQIVGAQLQTENITTLHQYRECGTKAQLVQRYVEAVVADCGRENQQAAGLILYLLTDENNTRPLKTRIELETDLKELASDLASEVYQLDLVLKIFVDSRLVFLLPDNPANRYQLVHDYLVALIRRQQEPKLATLTKQLEQERTQRKLSEQKLSRVEQNIEQIIVRTFIMVPILSFILIISTVLWVLVNDTIATYRLQTRQEAQMFAIALSNAWADELENQNWSQIRLGINLLLERNPSFVYLLVSDARLSNQIVAAAPADFQEQFFPDVVSAKVTESAWKVYGGTHLEETYLLRTVELPKGQLRGHQGEPIMEVAADMRDVSGEKKGTLRIGISLRKVNRNFAHSTLKTTYRMLLAGSLIIGVNLIGCYIFVRRLTNLMRHRFKLSRIFGSFYKDRD